MKKAYTLAESLIVMMIISIVLVVITNTVRQRDFKQEVLLKSGANMLYQIDFASKQILARNSINYSFYHLVSKDGTEFLITDAGADAKLSKLFQNYLKGIHASVKADYLNLGLKNVSNNPIANVNVSSFKNGIILSNGTYFALKLNNNCTTNETYIYSPVQKDKRTATRSCGLIFYDVNAEKLPNLLGADQYILPIGKKGLK